ncbi:DUF2851 family protein [Mucilaginibacter sp. RS28]|uniref:DUF2851 family protein n=1 Tax=Mucilaginibacter straminoryzae TaxID=2932774 RepID=A0A9X1X156_9SPHI|nr:DUF2851 family protein [Mucilaginibacter straminoryzae]MCJ8209322.1 DUF2851 family protein [Mucilaginibacter straminoryzae]
MLFTEDFLYYVWKFRLYDRNLLQTTAGEPVEIIHPGMQNTNAGPDFYNARIKIGDTLWAGNVEIHVAASDWHKHGHHRDKAYENVILHVVYKNDMPESVRAKTLPILELNERINGDLYSRYHNLIYGNQQIIPCEGTIKTVDDLTLRNWMTRVLVERLEKKSTAVLKNLEHNRGDWEETFYQHLAANFGFKVNALPFEMMAKSLPQQILGKHKNSPLQIEALVFGQAGFLEDEFKDDYPKQLKTEYGFLRKKYNLQPIEKHLWKFARMRPLNFPTLRLAQFAALVVQSNHLFSKIIEIADTKTLHQLFDDVAVNTYWDNHYRFEVESKPALKTMGSSSVDNLMLNTIALFLFSYGKQYQQQKYTNRALQLLEQLPAENNAIVNDFVSLGVKIKTAFDSQALLELRSSYCNHKQCLQCGVGNKILRLT